MIRNNWSCLAQVFYMYFAGFPNTTRPGHFLVHQTPSPESRDGSKDCMTKMYEYAPGRGHVRYVNCIFFHCLETCLELKGLKVNSGPGLG